jgi:membrane protein required for colicin V production
LIRALPADIPASAGAGAIGFGPRLGIVLVRPRQARGPAKSGPKGAALTILDVIVIVVVLISAMLAMVRGLVREVLSIASWVVGAGAAYLLYKPVVPVLKPYIANTTIQSVAAAAVVFVVALVVATYVTSKIADFVVDSRVGAVDRAFGFLFGAARGVLLLVVALMFFDWLVNPSPAWVAHAQTRPVLEDLGTRLMAALPADLETTIMNRLRGQSEDAGTGGQATPAAVDPGATGATPGYSGAEQRDLNQLIQNSTAQPGK